MTEISTVNAFVREARLTVFDAMCLLACKNPSMRLMQSEGRLFVEYTEDGMETAKQWAAGLAERRRYVKALHIPTHYKLDAETMVRAHCEGMTPPVVMVETWAVHPHDLDGWVNSVLPKLKGTYPDEHRDD